MSGEYTSDTERVVDLRKQSSMDYWWPRLAEVDVPTPDTRRIEIRNWDEATEFHEDLPMQDIPMGTLTNCIKDVGGPPAFLRTDQASAKHFMEKASRVTSTDGDDLYDYVFELLTQNELAGFSGLPWRSIYVREWLPLWSDYSAFRGTAIAPEVRVFVLEGEVRQSGFYWPKDAIKQPNIDDWEKRHDRTRKMALNSHRQGVVTRYAETLADEFDSGYWSVDFALTENDQWYCIDMARGEVSWHPDSCDKLRSLDTASDREDNDD